MSFTLPVYSKSLIYVGFKEILASAETWSVVPKLVKFGSKVDF